MKSKSEILQAVKEFSKEIGAPDAIIADASGEKTSKALRKYYSNMVTTLKYLEEGTSWANKGKLFIGLIKEAIRKDTKEFDFPLDFWDYCVGLRARINNLTANSNFSLHGANTYTSLTGKEGDISNLCQYKWYDWWYYIEHKEFFTFNQKVPGRVLGHAVGTGNDMVQWILKSNG